MVLQEANILALFVQAILYGFYLMLVILSLRWLILDDREWRLRRYISRIMLSTTILFFVFLTSNLLLSLLMSIVAMRGQTTAYNRYGTVNNIIENTTILMADAVLIYRCWMVYTKSWRIIFIPILLWLTALSCSVLVICSQLIVGWKSRFYYLWAVFYCSNISTNIYATAAIIFRIWHTIKRTGHGHSRLRNVSRILSESGSLYTLASSMNLASSIIGGPPIVRYISDAVNFSMTGITFNFILICVHLSRVDATINDTDTPNSIATPHLSGGLKSLGHTSEHSTSSTITSESSYTEIKV